MYPMILMMKKERRMIASPMIAKVSVFFAASTCLGSPLEVISLIPEMMIKKSATIPANMSAALITFSKTIGIQSKVAILFGSPAGPERQSSQDLNIAE